MTLLSDDRGVESVELAIVAGIVVAGLVAVVAFLVMRVMKALRSLRGEIDP